MFEYLRQTYQSFSLRIKTEIYLNHSNFALKVWKLFSHAKKKKDFSLTNDLVFKKLLAIIDVLQRKSFMIYDTKSLYRKKFCQKTQKLKTIEIMFCINECRPKCFYRIIFIIDRHPIKPLSVTDWSSLFGRQTHIPDSE